MTHPGQGINLSRLSILTDDADAAGNTGRVCLGWTGSRSYDQHDSTPTPQLRGREPLFSGDPKEDRPF